MLIQFISLFPEMFPPMFETSMLYKAKDKGIVEYRYIDLRQYGLGPRKTVDDTPYGGGDGMLLRVEPLFAAIREARERDPEAVTYYMSPRGEQLKQARSQAIADASKGMIIVCGRYEGIDERVLTLIDSQISVGDYVVTGGELPAMILADSVIRLIPGVLGGEASALIESFSDGETLEFPQYTRPEEFEGMKVPDVLLSGNHGQIAAWRQENSQKSNS
ncbi:MAG: tRNA (guanosine(37)-N1)-methyltransferase TrmD [Candidatus Saccharimonadales bacterium]